MKKIFSLIAAILFVGGMMAEEATMAKGTTNSYDNNTINGKFSIKMGKSGAGGNMTITVGEGATSLKFKAAAWKGESAPVTITAPSGVTLDPAEITVKACDALSGTGSAWTIENEDNYLCEIILAGVKAETTLTLTSTKRAFVWDAEYSTGAAPAVYAPKIEAPQEVFYKELEVTITCATEGADIYYTLDGTDPSYVGAILYSGPFKINETTKVRAVAEKGDDYSSKVEKTFTKAEVWSVSRAISELDMTTPLPNKYVKGKIVEVESFSEQYKSITYWIEDLENPGVKLEVYSGLGLNGAEFASVDDLKVGYVVTVFGNLKIYKKEGQADIYEFDKNSIIVELDKNPQGITNTSVQTKAVKTIQNGQLVIIKNGVRFNALGAQIQ